jgi:DNA-binding transcriptional LysR family regulator
VAGRVTVATHEAATAAAAAGLGVSVNSTWGCRSELATGALVRLLSDWSLPSVDLHAVFPPSRDPSPAARAFVDYLAAALRPR